MPLILITGYPSSGKSYRARQLLAYCDDRIANDDTASSKKLRTHLVDDASLSITRDVYDLERKTQHERSNNASEKDARAAIYGAVKRVLSDRDIVIVDAAGGNYIKGWRYQLHCEAKAVRTGSCVVHVGTPVEKAREVNELRLGRDQHESTENASDSQGRYGDHVQTGLATKDTELAYDPETWNNLLFRFEEPNGMNRWDSPLFTVLWEDATPAYEDIWSALVADADGKKVVVRPNAATVLKSSTGEGYLHELDRATQEVVTRIIDWIRDHDGESGGEVDLCVDEKTNKHIVIDLPTNPVNLPTLQRLRRQFISMSRQNTVSVGRIKASFVAYLNDSFTN